jgi:NitT/TauT family transport system substrate-binding protein
MVKRGINVFGRLVAVLAVALACTGAASAQATKLQVAYLPILPMAQLFIIEGEGWAKAAGLDLELTEFSSGPALVQALASGRFDVAYVGIGPVMVARANGVDLKVVAANGVDQVSLIGRGELAASFAHAASPADAFIAFHQHTGHAAKLATLPKGSVPDTVLRYWLTNILKLPPQEVEILGVGEDRVQQLLLSGAVDGGSILEPILTIVQERDPNTRILADGNAMFPNQPGAVLAVRERTIAASPKAVAQLVALHVRASELLRTNPDGVAPFVRDAIGKGLISLATIDAALKSKAMHPVADPHAIIAATRAMQDFQLSLGVMAKPVVIDELFDTKFYDAAVSSR